MNPQMQGLDPCRVGGGGVAAAVVRLAHVEGGGAEADLPQEHVAVLRATKPNGAPNGLRAIPTALPAAFRTCPR